MHDSTRPLLAITLGDPAGNGPEIIAKMASLGAVDEIARFIVVGDARMMERAFGMIGQAWSVRAVDDVRDARFEPNTLDVLDLKNVDHDALVMGKVQAMAGQAAYEAIVRSVELAQTGQVDGVVTSAIHKEALRAAGHHYEGHAELLADLTNADPVAGMLAAGEFRVTHVSTHCSLREAVERCKKERVLDVVRLTHNALRQMGIERPRLAVAGLNPHSGEHGLFGREDMDEIQPAIDAARAEGMDVAPYPVPGDTVFVRMFHFKEFDAVVAQYHDQGHVAAKLVDFFGGVNITLGLPIIRTSVDHGTAFDIAGTGKANPDSLIAAVRYAVRMIRHRT